MTDFIRIGIYLIIAGFGLAFTGSILSAGNPSFSGLIMIGPIPVAFGSSPEMTVIAMLIGLIMMFLFFRMGRRND